MNEENKFLKNRPDLDSGLDSYRGRFRAQGLKAMTLELASWRVPPVSEERGKERGRERPGRRVSIGLVPGPVLGWLGRLAFFFVQSFFFLFFSFLWF